MVNPFFLLWVKDSESHLSKERMLLLLPLPLPASLSLPRKERVLPSHFSPPPLLSSFSLQEEVGEEAVVCKEGSYFTHILNNREENFKNGYYVIYLQTNCIKLSQP